MQNINGEQIIIDKDLFSLIEFAKWELYNFNLLKKSSKLTKVELILIDKDIIKNGKKKVDIIYLKSKYSVIYLR